MSKKYLLYFSLFFIQHSVIAQFDTIIHQNKLNIAVLKLNYTDFSIQGGKMLYYDCLGCTKDSIPFNVDYQEPMDFGSICLKLNPSLDTVFSGSMIWMGTGVIDFPSNFNASMPFMSGNSVIQAPNNIQLLNQQGQQFNNATIINQCWNTVSTLEITESFSNFNYHAAIYLYTPKVGLTDYNYAKWIVFLYYQDAVAQIDDINFNDYQVFPNPFNDKIYVSNNLNDFEFNIFSSLGEKLKTGKIRNGEINDISQLTSGVYYIDLIKDDKKITRKIIKN
jgi:hypothetical protein